MERKVYHRDSKEHIAPIAVEGKERRCGVIGGAADGMVLACVLDISSYNYDKCMKLDVSVIMPWCARTGLESAHCWMLWNASGRFPACWLHWSYSRPVVAYDGIIMEITLYVWIIFWVAHFIKRFHIHYMADSRFVPSQWETPLLCNDVSHWLGANLESALNFLLLHLQPAFNIFLI